jgi:hypothetical protein
MTSENTELKGECVDKAKATIQIKHLPLLLRPKQTCELFGIDLKALHKLETSGRVKAVRIGPKKVQRRYSPVAVAKALGVDLMAENYTLVAGMDFAREVGNSIAEASEDVLGKTRALIQSQLEGLNSAVREIVRGELSRALESKTARPKPQPRTETHRIPSYIPPQVPKGY